MKKLINISLFMLITFQGFSQVITGSLKDNKKQPIAYGNIKLEHLDSTFVAGVVSDESGIFNLSAPESGDYLLIISFMGYSTSIIRLDNLNRKTDLGEIVLYEASQTLGEVTVSASRVMTKLDRQVILPSEMQIKTSSSGYDLLNKLLLPGVKIDIVQNSISTIGGGRVELRINDIKASAAQVQALRPTSVIRVEYIDNPGIRYADSGVEAVINYIVKRQESGISGGVNLMNAATTGFGNDNVYIKMNHKRSEFGLNYYVSYRDYDDRYSDEKQQYSLANNEVRQRILDGVPVPFGYTNHQLEMSYNLTIPDKYVFNAVFRQGIYRSPHQDFSQIIIEKGKENIQSYIESKDNSELPSLDLYYQLTLPKKQMFSVNLVGTYIGTTYEREYNEYMPETPDNTLSSYGYITDGNRYSIIGEAIYKKEFKRTVLSAGIQGLQAYTKNIYSGTPDETSRMHNSNLYGYLQLQGNVKKLSYMLGAGVSRQYFKQSDVGYTFITFRPSIVLSYPVFKGASLRYNFSITPNLPSLATLSDIPRQKTDIEVERGNPSLNPYRTYSSKLTFSWGNKFLSTQLSGSYLCARNPIMGEITRVDNASDYMFVYSVNNQKKYTQWNGQFYVQGTIIPNKLIVTGYGGVNKFNTIGNSYSHSYIDWYGGAKVSFTYKACSLYAGLDDRYNSLFGEDIYFGENNSYLQMVYRVKKLQLGLGVLYPFTPKGWSAGSKLLSDLIQKESWTYIKDNRNMVFISIGWDFNYGRKHQVRTKTLNNSDNDSGIAK